MPDVHLTFVIKGEILSYLHILNYPKINLNSTFKEPGFSPVFFDYNFYLLLICTN